MSALSPLSPNQPLVPKKVDGFDYATCPCVRAVYGFRLPASSLTRRVQKVVVQMVLHVQLRMKGYQ